MRHVKKLASLLLALVMVLAMTTTTFAAGTTGTITINDAIKDNVYKVYKVFNASGNGRDIAYTLIDGKTTAPAGFRVDENGNVVYADTSTNGELTPEDIAAIAEYVKNDTPVATVTAEGSTVTVPNLPNGYYYITTTTGTAVTVTSTNPDAVVTDKNEAPKLDKKITGVGDGSFDSDGKKALAEVGTTVTYTATIEVKNGAVGYVFHDKMSAGLAYNESSLKVQVGGVDVAAANYDKTTAQGDTLTLTFDDTWIKTQVGKTITITYNATVTSDALTVDAANNTATVDYGHDGKTNTTPESSTQTYNAKFTVTKTDGNDKPLAGAGFVVAKTENGAIKYYKKDGNDIKWVEDINDATELITTEGDNVVVFTGLADGTYTLIEKTVPAGYNKAANEEFTITRGDYSQQNLEQAKTVVNQSGAVLPSTGGVGTTIFYVVGSILLVGAAILLIAKKRMNAAK